MIYQMNVYIYICVYMLLLYVTCWSSLLGAFTAMKLAPLWFAVAFAKSVLPQPGGPKSSTPTGTVRPQNSEPFESFQELSRAFRASFRKERTLFRVILTDGDAKG